MGGNPGALAKYERLIGLNSWCVSEDESYLGYSSDAVLNNGTASLVSVEWKRLMLLKKALLDSDIIHLNNGRFIYPFFGAGVHPKEKKYNPVMRKLARVYSWVMMRIEKYLYRYLNKCVFVTFQGDDARQVQCFPEECRDSGFANDYLMRAGVSDREKKRKINYLSQVAYKIYALNPDLIEVLPPGAKFLPYSSESVFKKHDLKQKTAGPLIIGHAPTNRQIKGTKYIVAAVAQLKEQGFAVELKLIEGLNHTDALKEYGEIDVFVDQLIVGWYGVAAVELMSMGKIVLCYIGDKGRRHLPGKFLEELPILNASPKSVYEMLKKCLQLSHEERIRIGQRSIKFVRKWHNPGKIAVEVTKDYREAIGKAEGGPRCAV